MFPSKELRVRWEIYYLVCITGNFLMVYLWDLGNGFRLLSDSVTLQLLGR